MSNTAANYLRSRELLSRDSSLLVVIDVQEKLAPLICETERLLVNCSKLVQSAKLFNVPSFATEQYPQGLGPTVPSLAEHLPVRPSKLRFSSAEVLNWPPAAERTDDRFQVVLCGIEAHVCVLQTAFDLLAAGYQVFLAADAVGSRRQLDWKIALDRLAAAGATIVTTESVLFEWCETAEASEFKQFVAIVKPKNL
ncbi:MAG: hydrolase [Planctomycetota bacterium]